MGGDKLNVSKRSGAKYTSNPSSGGGPLPPPQPGTVAAPNKSAPSAPAADDAQLAGGASAFDIELGQVANGNAPTITGKDVVTDTENSWVMNVYLGAYEQAAPGNAKSVNFFTKMAEKSAAREATPQGQVKDFVGIFKAAIVKKDAATANDALEKAMTAAANISDAASALDSYATIKAAYSKSGAETVSGLLQIAGGIAQLSDPKADSAARTILDQAAKKAKTPQDTLAVASDYFVLAQNAPTDFSRNLSNQGGTKLYAQAINQAKNPADSRSVVNALLTPINAGGFGLPANDSNVKSAIANALSAAKTTADADTLAATLAAHGDGADTAAAVKQAISLAPSTGDALAVRSMLQNSENPVSQALLKLDPSGGKLNGLYLAASNQALDMAQNHSDSMNALNTLLYSGTAISDADYQAAFNKALKTAQTPQEAMDVGNVLKQIVNLDYDWFTPQLKATFTKGINTAYQKAFDRAQTPQQALDVGDHLKQLVKDGYGHLTADGGKQLTQTASQASSKALALANDYDGANKLIDALESRGDMPNAFQAALKAVGNAKTLDQALAIGQKSLDDPNLLNLYEETKGQLRPEDIMKAANLKATALASNTDDAIKVLDRYQYDLNVANEDFPAALKKAMDVAKTPDDAMKVANWVNNTWIESYHGSMPGMRDMATQVGNQALQAILSDLRSAANSASPADTLNTASARLQQLGSMFAKIGASDGSNKVADLANQLNDVISAYAFRDGDQDTSWKDQLSSLLAPPTPPDGVAPEPPATGQAPPDYTDY